MKQVLIKQGKIMLEEVPAPKLESGKVVEYLYGGVPYINRIKLKKWLIWLWAKDLQTQQDWYAERS